jgi:transcriptional regulator GlxA family with amidase domain
VRSFVLTDGFTCQSHDMLQALHRSERSGVQVVGISVGVDMTATRGLHQHRIQAALPSELPHAFTELYTSDERAAIFLC